MKALRGAGSDGNLSAPVGFGIARGLGHVSKNV
jgi:hypothetical protein